MTNYEMNYSDSEPLDRAAYLLRLEKSRVYLELENKSEAEEDLYEAVKVALQMAEKAEREDDSSLFIDAINKFKRLLLILEEQQFMLEAFAEIHVVIAICYHRIGLPEKAKIHGTQALNLEPNNQAIQEMGHKYGWIDSTSN